MPIPTKPNEQRIRFDNDFTWEQFAKDCVLNKYALVVGPEAILNLEIGGNSRNCSSISLHLGLPITSGTH